MDKAMLKEVMSWMGKRGGKARAEKLSAKRLSEISAMGGKASGKARLGVKRGPYKKKQAS